MNEIEERLTALERRIESQQFAIETLRIGRSMPSRFLATCCAHWLGIAILTSLAHALPLSVVNGWMFGVLNTGCLWLGMVKLPMSTKILQCAAIVLLMSLTSSFLDELADEGISEVLLLALFVFPAFYLAVASVAKSIKFALHSPALEHSESKPLSIRSFLLGTTIVAGYASFLRAVQSDTPDPSFVWLVVALVAGMITIAIWTLACSLQRPYERASRISGLLRNAGVVLSAITVQTLILVAAIVVLGNDTAIQISWIQLKSTGFDQDLAGLARIVPVCIESAKFTLASFIPMVITYTVVKRVGFSAVQKRLNRELSGGSS